MILTEIRLRNFRVYDGEHVLTLRGPEKGRNVYLIGGANGAGKTSLLQAIALGLYGIDAAGLAFDRSGMDVKGAYRRHIEESLTTGLRESGGQMEVALSFAHDGKAVRVQRTWWFERGGALDDEALYIYEDEAPVRVDVENEDERNRVLQEYIEGIAPARVAKFFFFDGEEIKTIAARDPDLSVVEGLNQLLGFEYLRRLSDDLQTVRASLRRELPGASESGLSGAVAEAEELRAQLLTAHAELAEAQKSRDASSRQLEAVEAELQTMFDGRAIQSRSEALDALAERERELASISNEIQVFVADVLTLTLPGKLAEATSRRANREASTRRIREAKSRLRPLKDALADLLFSEEIVAPNQEEILRQRLSEAWVQLVESGADERGILGVFRTEELEAVPNAITEAKATARRELGARLARRAHIQAEIQRLRRIQNIFETGGRAQELLSRKSSLVRMLIEQEAAIDRREKWTDSLDQELAIKSGVVTRLEAELAADGSVRAELDLLQRTQTAIDAFMDELRSRKAAGLAEKTTQMMTQLVHKEDLLDRVVVDPASFAIRLERATGEELMNPSAGEREVFALSLVWALAQISARSLPMIIDTPLGRLDQAHRSNIVTRFFPVASEQLLVLSTDSEIDTRWYEALKPAIVQEVLINYSADRHSSVLLDGEYFNMPAAAVV